jgi:hypothetical protein
MQLVKAKCKREGAASVPDGVIGICHNPSSRTMALSSTQTPTKLSGILPGVKAAGE